MIKVYPLIENNEKNENLLGAIAQKSRIDANTIAAGKLVLSAATGAGRFQQR